MTRASSNPPTTRTIAAATAARKPPAGRLLIPLLRLARPHQWSKSAFVLVGPFYHLPQAAHDGRELRAILIPALLTAAMFALVSSACYVVNDILDVKADRLHPRKRNRPIASGAVKPGFAWAYALALAIAGFAGLIFLPGAAPSGQAETVTPRLWVAGALLLYAANVTAYSAFIKRSVITDVMSLSVGFVLRVMAGCWAVAIMPTVWLLNVSLFLAMFLSFGKRLGERKMLLAALANDPDHDPRTAAQRASEAAALHRAVQAFYTDTLLQMAVVVTGVATLMGYAAYVQAQADKGLYYAGFNLLWLTILPATYCLLRAIVQLERGAYDDPTELAVHDRAFQAGAAVFAIVTAGVMWGFRGA